MGENGSAEQVMFDWLIDTPLFVSTERIESLYNAIALPETEEQARTISRKGTSSESTGTSLGLELAAETGFQANLTPRGKPLPRMEFRTVSLLFARQSGGS